MSSVHVIKKLVFGMRTRLTRQALRLGVGASIEHKRLLSQHWRTIVDVGANRGQFTLAAVTLCVPTPSVYSFEPLSGPAAIFARLFRDVPGIRLFPCAIGPDQRDAEMHVSARDDSSSLLPISEEQVRTFPGTEEATTERVNVCPLSEKLTPADIQKPALLKLDVQGYEFEALQGCAALLPQFDAIYVECSLRALYEGQHLLGDIVVWLKGRGFELQDIGEVTRDRRGSAIQADFLFRRSA